MFRHLCFILREFQNLSFAKLHKDDKEVSKHVAVNIIQREHIVIYICAIVRCNNKNNSRNTFVKFLASTSRDWDHVNTVKSAKLYASAVLGHVAATIT